MHKIEFKKNMSELDCCKWNKTKIPFSFKVGEWCLFRCFLDGIWCTTDIFLTSECFSSAIAPIHLMKKEHVQLARLESYPLCNKIPYVSINDKCLCFVDSMYKHYYVETRGDFKKYIALKKSIFSTIKRKIKKIEASNKHNSEHYFEIYSTPDDFSLFLDIAIPIAKKTFQHLLLDRGLPDTEEFRSYVREKSEKGEVIGYILKVDDKPVAYNFCPIYNGNRVLYDYSGYDPHYKDYSPGTVLQFKIIEDLFNREEIDYYDLCTGEGWHKEMFATGSLLCGNFYFCFIYSRYVPVIAANIIFFFTIMAFKNILDYFGIKKNSKRMIRKFAVRFKSILNKQEK